MKKKGTSNAGENTNWCNCTVENYMEILKKTINNTTRLQCSSQHTSEKTLTQKDRHIPTFIAAYLNGLPDNGSNLSVHQHMNDLMRQR